MQRCNKLPKLEKIGENSSQWSKLPQQILSKIASFLELEGPSEKSMFKLVCKKWYASTCFTSGKNVLYGNLPIKLSKIPPIFIQDKDPIIIVGTCVFIVKPLDKPLTQPWLVFVEELNLGKLRIYYPLTKKPISDLPLNFRKGVNLSGFRVSVIRQGLKICFENGNEDVVRAEENKNRLFGFSGRTKVILASNGKMAIVLLIRKGGVMMSFNLSTGKWMILDTTRVSRFDDIVCFKGLVYAMDRKGRLYLIDLDVGIAKVGNVVAIEICGGNAHDTRKRLIVLDKELHMINRTHRKFEVYKLNERRGKWDEVNSLGDRIVVAGADDAFGVNVSDFPRCRGNCILFSKHCFPSYMGSCRFENEVFRGAEKYLEVGVYYLGKHHYSPISSYPDLCDMLRPFPSWICSNSLSVASSSRETSLRVTVMKSCREVLDMPVASSAQTSREDIAKLVSEIPHQSNDDSVQATCYIPQIPESGSPIKTLRLTSDEVPEKPFPEIIDVDSDPDEAFQNTNAENVEKFEGVNVSSCFIPILHKIRNKLGNIIPGNVDEVQSDSIFLKCCFETVARAVKILLSDSARSLSDSDAKFLGACLSDLQFMRCKAEVVNWLVPFVRSALDLHHENKEQICKLQELQSVRLKMLDLLHQFEEEEKKIADDLSVSPFLDIKMELC